MLHIPLTLYLLLIKILGIIALFWGTNSTFAAVTKTNYHYLTMVVFSEDHIQETRRRGRIEVICGSMFSGKTEELIRRLKRAKFARQRVEIFKPALDTRYSEEEVVSHDSNSIASTPIDTSASILLFSSDKDVIGIDEAQFFDEGLINVCNQLADSVFCVPSFFIRSPSAYMVLRILRAIRTLSILVLLRSTSSRFFRLAVPPVMMIPARSLSS